MSEEGTAPAWLHEFAAEVRALPPIRVFRPLPGAPGPHWLARILRRLARRFPRLEVRPPADSAALDRLRRAIPACPADVFEFLSVCDGLDARCLVGCDFDGWIYGADRMVEIHGAVAEPWGPRYVPLRGDGGGGGDCLVAGAGIAEGAVVSCDRERSGPTLLVASGLWTYLDMWSDWLVHSFDRRGRQIDRGDAASRSFLRRHPEISKIDFVLAVLSAAESAKEGPSRTSHPWPYRSRWIARRDAGFAALANSLEVTAWLAANGHPGETPPS